MTFKEKHLLPLALTAALTMSCGENKNPFYKDKDIDSKGLLDEKPQKDMDKYNTAVTLYQVDVPVYDAEGNRLENYAVLTRGLKNSTYVSPQTVENMRVKEVYLNGDQKTWYVKADTNNAIYTKDGFSGLFIDYNSRAVIVADNNVEQFVNDLGANKIMQRLRAERRHVNDSARENIVAGVTKSVAPKDTIPSDSLRVGVEMNHQDTVKSDSVPTSVSAKDTFTDTQFLDTLRSIHQKEK